VWILFLLAIGYYSQRLFSFVRVHEYLASLSISLLAVCSLSAQTDTVLPRYPFIVHDSSHVRNDEIALHLFYEKLSQLQKTKEGKLNIVHIGDSHIQADFFSGELRQHFQREFGNAGRGLIFPYRVAKTNEPLSFKTSTNVNWEAKRNAFPKQALPIGVSGITIETTDTAAEIKLTVKDQENLDYGFNKITLFHAKSEENFDFAIYDSLYREIAYVDNLNDSTDKYSNVIMLDKPYKHVIIKSCPRNTSQTCARIYGMLLENNCPGVVYDMIGVNGAEYRHYNQSQYFIEQLSVLKPDLVIISMGTNEGYAMGFDSHLFYLHIDSLVTAIKRSNPSACFLLTTPGDSFRRTRKGRVKNPDMQEARNTIVNYCQQNNIAYWDLYEVMGGYGSMQKWFKAGLTAKDRLHFNGRGYGIQADLMYKAIISGYTKYKKE